MPTDARPSSYPAYGDAARPWWVRLGRYALPQWPSLILIAVATLALVGIKLLVPWPLKLIVDHVLADRPLPEPVAWIVALPGAGSARGLLAWLAAATVLLFLAKRLVNVLLAYVRAGAGSRMVYALATDLFQHLQNRSLIFHGRQRVGDLVQRVTMDSGCVRDLVMQVYLPLATSLATLISMFAVMWHLSATMALFAAAMAVPLWLVTRYFDKPMSERKYAYQEVQGEVMSLAEQTLTAMPVVQAFGREALELRRFRDLAERAVQANVRFLVSQEQFKLGTGGLTALATAIVMLVGGLAVARDAMSVGDLLVLLAYFAALYSPLENLAYLGPGFASAAAGARRVFEMISADEHAVVEAAEARALPVRSDGAGAHVRIERLTFGYETGRPVLHDVSVEAEPGQTVALVGPTGAGKSTLVSLIARLYDPWQGEIRIDGHDLRGVRLSSLRENIAIVMQDPFLLRLSVAENIAYGRPQATRREIIAAAEAASAAAFIAELPDGYDTVIGERGMTLSGGQKQRLSIARAFLKNAPLLLLDEPTSALDPQTEAYLIDALKRLKQGRTTFLIAHRLSTARTADRIVVLSDGRVVETGSHDELRRAGGVYERMWSLQSSRRDGSPGETEAGS